jgi:alpha-L-rhamnosidase
MGTLVAGLLSTAAAFGSLQPEQLRCEYRQAPEGMGELHPRLGWSLSSSDAEAKNLSQTGYRIVVVTSEAALQGEQDSAWDSGKVLSNQSQNIVYAGNPLKSDTDYWWKVRVWDQAGMISDWSPAGHWSTGLLTAGEWRAKWIGLDTDSQAQEGEADAAQRRRVQTASWAWPTAPATEPMPGKIFVRRGFTIPAQKHLTRASLFLTPDQTCAITLNGQSVGSVAKWDRAAPINLLPHVRAGDNVVGMRIEQHDGLPPAVLGELELNFSDGQVYRTTVDPTWHYATSVTARWDQPGFALGANWRPLALIPGARSPWGTPQDATLFLPPAPFFRKDFTLNQPVRKALLHATALGLYEVHLNGKRIGRNEFTPGWTDYLHRVPYQTYDVTAELKLGTNALGAILGDGWYAGTVGFLGRRLNYGGYPRFAAQLDLELADGSRVEVLSDGSWRAANGPIKYADLLQGYAYDARREWTGWDSASFNAADWSPVAVGLRATGMGPAKLNQAPIIEAATMDSVQISDRLPAVAVSPIGANDYLVDFGQDLVGWVQFRVTGRPGQRIVVRHGEMLNANGTLYTANLRGAAAVDTYWLKGNGPEVLEPRFTFHGFRYAQLSGLDHAPAPADLVGIVAGTHLERVGEFECSNPLINQLYHNIIWGQKGNYFDVPTDCPQRDERLGWTGDTEFFMPTAAYNFNVASFIESWLVTLATDEQAADGSFPDVAPSVGREGKAVTAWGDAAVTCTYDLWKVYGDTRVVTEHLPQLLRYLDYLRVNAAENIASVGGYGDWLNKGGGAKTEVIDTAYYAHLCGLVAEMARAVGQSAEAERAAESQRQVTAAFEKAFFAPDGSIRESSQTGYALAFTMDLIPNRLRATSSQKFVDEIAAHGWHLATGFIGTPRLLPALHEAGRDDVAYRLLLQETYPSWLFQVKAGATTMWERWDGWSPDKGFQTVEMNSFNHYAFGSVGEYLYRVVAGIDSDQPGFRHIVLQPTPGIGLTWAKASFAAPSGKISSAWKIAGGKLIVDATLPPNTTAKVVLPGQAAREVGSGTYHWEIPFSP